MTLLLSKIPVLDKGFVARVDSGCSGVKLNELAVEYFKRLDGKFLAPDLSSLTLLIKCPLFVQLNLSTCRIQVTNLPYAAPAQPEVYLPNVGEIGAPSLEVSRGIADDIARTSSALLMNPKAYQADGCDRFVAQILTPLNTYTTVLVHGMYNDWCRFISQSGVPASIAAYINAVDQILKAEWP